MRSLQVLAAGTLILGACSGGGPLKRATSDTTIAVVSAGRAPRLCSTLRGIPVSASPTTVDRVRHVRDLPPHSVPLSDVFSPEPGSDFAAWCVTTIDEPPPRIYSFYVVSQTGNIRSVFDEVLSEPPPPGPPRPLK
jgi:hypothetical protein